MMWGEEDMRCRAEQPCMARRIERGQNLRHDIGIAEPAGGAALMKTVGEPAARTRPWAA
jgi:hypothetical protein